MAADETDNRRTRSFSAWKSVRLGETEDLIEGLKANPVDEEDFFDLDIRTINSFIPKQNMKRTRPQEVSHRGMDKANAHEWFWGGCQRRGGGNDSTLSYFICGGEGAYFDDNQSLVVVVEAAEGIAICIFNKMSLLKSF